MHSLEDFDKFSKYFESAKVQLKNIEHEFAVAKVTLLLHSAMYNFQQEDWNLLELFSFTPTDKDTTLYWKTFFIPQKLGILLTNRYPIGNIRDFYDMSKGK
jgi:hypothetical protein